jgi:hypothetical protein
MHGEMTLSGLVCLAVALALYFKATRLHASDGLGGIGDHLAEFGNAWLILAVYYLILAALVVHPGFSAHSLPLREQELTRGPLFLHLFILIACTATNFYLVRAMAHLAPGMSIGSSASKPSLIPKAKYFLQPLFAPKNGPRIVRKSNDHSVNSDLDAAAPLTPLPS